MPPEGHDPFTRTDPDQEFFDLQATYEAVMDMPVTANETELEVWLIRVAAVVELIVLSPYTVSEISRAWEQRIAGETRG